MDEWLTHNLPQRYENRIIPVAGHAAFAWAYLMALSKRNGRRFASMDELIAATAVAHPLSLATRNIRDLESFGIQISDQWVD